FVGADALTLGLTLDKVVAKQVFLGEGIPTAEFFSTDNPDDAETLNTIGYPLIVKTRHEGSSKGITEESKVNNLEELKKRIRFVVENYNQPALVEKFISGQEFTIAVLGNGEEAQAMPVVQTSINGQKDFEDKVYTNRNIYDGSVKYLCPAPVSAELTKTLQNLAVQVFRAVDCRDLARVDFRVDKKGQPYVLEINPLPSFDVEDVFHLFPKCFGASFEETIKLILNLALKRYNLIDKNFPIFYQQELMA
ncbi:MAG: ATP-grasp domain-containing protein, partial [Candidatus Omnitrophica bacterium]|nr:ATP-grasp domain-containing protein [Candidatus Omnitrophota bacterium]